METTAGSGTAIGATFEDLAELTAAIPEPMRSRVGVCVDSCHVYSAGYDLAREYDDVWARFDDRSGWRGSGSCISTTRRRRSPRTATDTS